MNYSRLKDYSINELRAEYISLVKQTDYIIMHKPLGERHDLLGASLIIQREQVHAELISRQKSIVFSNFNKNNSLNYELN